MPFHCAKTAPDQRVIATGIPKPHFRKRIGEIDLRLSIWRFALAALRMTQARKFGQNFLAAVWKPGGKDEQMRSALLYNLPLHLQGDIFVCRMARRGKPNRALTDLLQKCLFCGGCIGQRWAMGL